MASMSFSAALCKNMFTRNDTHDMILAAVSKDGMLLRHVKYQTVAICKAALQQNWHALSFVQDLCDDIIEEAIQQNVEAASLLPPQKHLTAVVYNIHCFDFIKKPSIDCCRYVIRRMPEWITKRPNPPLELCLIAVEERFKNASFRARMNTAYHNQINYLRRDYLEGLPVTEELQNAALKPTNGYAILCYPQDVQLRLTEYAVQLNTGVYAYLPQTPSLNRIVCTAYPKNLSQILNPARDLVWDVAENWAMAIKYAEDQDEALCVHAVRHKHAAIAYVRKQRLLIWKKAGYTTPLSLTSLFPEFHVLMTRSATARTFFNRINTALQKQRPVSTKHMEPLEDPITMEPVEAGTLCAFLADTKGVHHFAGTLDSLLDLLKVGFHGSTVQNLFIPIKNALVPTQQLKWRQV